MCISIIHLYPGTTKGYYNPDLHVLGLVSLVEALISVMSIQDQNQKLSQPPPELLNYKLTSKAWISGANISANISDANLQLALALAALKYFKISVSVSGIFWVPM